MAGYCDTGRFRMDRVPASMMTMAMTQAKIGRSMKNFAMVPPSALFFAVGDADLGARADALQPFDDHAVARREAVADDPRVAGGALDGQRTRLDLVVAIDHHCHRV